MPKMQYRALWMSLVVAAILIIGAWAAICAAVSRDEATVRKASERDALNLAQVFEENVRSIISRVDRNLLLLRHDVMRGELTPERAQAILSVDGLFQVSIIDRNGFLRFSSLDDNPLPLDLSDREHFRAQKESSEDRLFISRPLLGRVSQKWSLQFTRKIFAADGTFDGVVVVSLDPKHLTELYGSIDVGPQGAITLVGTDGVIRARASANGVAAAGMSLPLDRPYFAADAPQSGLYETVSAIDGVLRLGAWRRVADYPLIVLVQLDKKAIFAEYEVRRQNLSMGGAGLSIAILVAAVAIGWMLQIRSRIAADIAVNEERWRTALEAVGDGVWDWDVRSDTFYTSYHWGTMLGYSDQDGIGRTYGGWITLLHPEDRDRAMRELRRHFDGETKVYRNEYRMRTEDGGYRWILSRGIVVVRGADGAALRVIGTHADITEQKTLEQRLRMQAEELRTINLQLAESERCLRELATTDTLTGLCNRRVFFEKAEDEWTRARRYVRPLSVIMFDIDHFKSVNDTHGHAAGDTVLRDLAQRIGGTIRRQDVLARIGGEEFVLLMPETALQHAMKVAEAIRHLVSVSPFSLSGGRTLAVTISLGVAAISDEASFDVLLEQADQALYKAKDGGRNRVAAAKEKAFSL